MYYEESSLEKMFNNAILKNMIIIFKNECFDPDSCVNRMGQNNIKY